MGNGLVGPAAALRCSQKIPRPPPCDDEPPLGGEQLPEDDARLLRAAYRKPWITPSLPVPRRPWGNTASWQSAWYWQWARGACHPSSDAGFPDHRAIAMVGHPAVSKERSWITGHHVPPWLHARGSIRVRYQVGSAPSQCASAATRSRERTGLRFRQYGAQANG